MNYLSVGFPYAGIWFCLHFFATMAIKSLGRPFDHIHSCKLKQLLFAGLMLKKININRKELPEIIQWWSLAATGSKPHFLMTTRFKEVRITMYLCPNPPSASLPICFPIVHSRRTSSLAVAAWFPTKFPHLCPSPASRLPACHLHHLSSFFPPAIFSSLGKSNTYRSISINLELRACMWVGWLLGREGQITLQVTRFANLQRDTIWNYFADLAKYIEDCQMFLKSVILIHWYFRALCAGRPFALWQTAMWVWCRDNEP